MDQDESSSAPKKVKFAPKAPPRRKPKPTVPQKEEGDDDGTSAREILRRFNEAHRRQVPKIEEKSSENQVTVRRPATPSTSVGMNASKSSASLLKECVSNCGEKILSLPSTSESDNAIVCSDPADASTEKIKKDYIEPWDYHHSYYPTTLPWRRPYSGNPDLLNAEEFGEDSSMLKYDESTMVSALELGMLEEPENLEMFLVQLPPILPVPKQACSSKGKPIAESYVSPGNLGISIKATETAGYTASLGRGMVDPSAKGIEIAGGSVPLGRGGDGATVMGKEIAGSLPKQAHISKGKGIAERSVSPGNLGVSIKGNETAGYSTSSGRERIDPSARGKERASHSVSLGRGGRATIKGKEIAGSLLSQAAVRTPKQPHSLDEFSGGYFGKMLVYKSGAIKLKLGETLYDVSPGSNCKFAQEVAAINFADKTCSVLGEVDKHIVVTPDVDSLLDSMMHLG